MPYNVTIVRDPGAAHDPESFGVRVAHRAQIPALVRTMLFATLGERESQSVADAAHRTFGDRATTGWSHTVRHGLKLTIRKE